MSRRVLGRGLSTLIPAPAEGTPARAGAGGEFLHCPIDRIRPAGSQPRRRFDEEGLEALAASIRAQGLVQPLVVRREGDGFVLIAGERRLRAAERAGLAKVPVVIRESTAAEAFEMALVENLQREDLNPLEEAEAYRRLQEDLHYSAEALAERVGRDRTTIVNAIRLLALPEEVRDLVRDGRLSAGHGRALLALRDADAMVEVAREVAAADLSVRAVEHLVRQRLAGSRGRRPRPAAERLPASLSRLEEDLARLLGARVRINERGGKGRIEIAFHSTAELTRLIDWLRR